LDTTPTTPALHFAASLVRRIESLTPPVVEIRVSGEALVLHLLDLEERP
jgi:hypothetical protein